ncbi:ArsB/NhaD family transporter [Segniliparus rugosus]|uniref:Citrate transporter-like domain-containing protein n=1 Tax=Segniliparus rugosus (strain ATCC BAA-974 / DSM 45345 / CCUG 50838 / CIP 108380 / JCM 13579 / CDC 945) TaxID=679197 RepID=E5XVB0_SEGRC|nr:ArsB/NhaD family transporter [Segniliparus rugosus]EFV11723.1 hypothetical protein HMPREF9336_03432 [Segniliparus rugosus ATCC BAA-974]
MLAFALRPVRSRTLIVAIPLCLGALAASLVPAHAALATAREILPVVLFLAAVLVLARLCEAEGLFASAGSLLARKSTTGFTLLASVFVLASATTAVLSLDATVVLLTPVVLVAANQLKTKAEPSLYACAHLANTASLLLPVSNLTNLLAFAALGLSFTTFTLVMALPCLLAIAVELLVFRWFFAAELDEPCELAAPSEPAQPAPRFALVVLAATLAGFALAGLVGANPALAAFAGAAVLGLRALRRGETTAVDMLRSAQPQFLVFVLALALVVRAVVDNGLGEIVTRLLPEGSGLPALLALAFAGAALSNLVNNLPALLILLPAVHHLPPAAVFAVLIGVNLGPNLTYVGSLATLLWRSVLHDRGVRPRLGRYTALGLATTPATLLVAVLALWLEATWFDGSLLGLR